MPKKKEVTVSEEPAKKEVKKEAKTIYTTARIGDTLIRISIKNNIRLDKLRELNPDIKGPAIVLKMGQKVRLK